MMKTQYVKTRLSHDKSFFSFIRELKKLRIELNSVINKSARVMLEEDRKIKRSRKEILKINNQLNKLYIKQMKLTTILFALMVLTGCQKDYTCTVTTSDGLETSTKFRGTKEEKQQYEADGTYQFGTTQVTTVCY